MYLHDEPDPGRWEDKPTEDTTCHLGISPQCDGEEGGYMWNGERCCAHCLTFMEQVMPPKDAA